jgi:hypothetical protein
MPKTNGEFDMRTLLADRNWEYHRRRGNACSKPYLKSAKPGSRFQFERLGYYCVDSKDSTDAKPVFNQTITLRDSWAKLEKKLEGGASD